MPSVDPNDTFLYECGNVSFRIRELKAISIRKIGIVLTQIGTMNNPADMLDALSPCALQYIASWNLSIPLTIENLESELTLNEIVGLLRAAIFGSKLNSSDKKKSE